MLVPTSAFLSMLRTEHIVSYFHMVIEHLSALNGVLIGAFLIIYYIGGVKK